MKSNLDEKNLIQTSGSLLIYGQLFSIGKLPVCDFSATKSSIKIDEDLKNKGGDISIRKAH